MAKMNAREARDYAIGRFTDGAPHLLILDELTTEKKLSEKAAAKAVADARAIIARDLDEPDYHFIRSCAFAADSYRQHLYRTRIADLLEEQDVLKGDAQLDQEVRMRLILACDRSMQGWATLSHRGRRDLPVAFAPKGVLQNQAPPTEDDIEDAIKGAL